MVDRKLGRGLDFFLSGGRRSEPAPARDATAAEPAKSTVPEEGAAPVSASPADPKTLEVDIGLLEPNPHQPRRVMTDAALDELAGSIKASGLLQPILVRPAGKRFQIVAGERRWRASQKAGLKKVPVWIKTITDEESAVFALVENVQREDLNAIEKAQAFKELVSRFQASQDEVAKKVGLNRSTVANFIRLLDLPKEVQEHVSRGTLSMGHARALLGLRDQAVRIQLGDEVVRQGMSVRALEDLVRQQELGGLKAASAAAKPIGKGKEKAAWLKEIEETLVDNFSTTVAVRYGRKKSVIQIECVGREEFERIYSRLKDC